MASRGGSARNMVVLVSAVALAVAAAAAPAGADGTDVLVGQWHLDTKTGVGPESTPDSSSSSLDASAASVTLDPSGRWSSSLSSSNATTLNASTSPVLAADEVTLIAWVKHSGPPPTLTYVAGKGGDGPSDGCGGSSYALATIASSPNNALAFYIRPAGGGLAYVSPHATGLWDGGWHMAAGVYDGSTVQLYVDGVAAGSATPAADVAIDYDLTDNSFTIDGYAASGCSFVGFPGGIDEVRVYNRALSAAELGRLAAASATPPVLVEDDVTPPTTTITAGPQDNATLAGEKAVFQFSSSEPGATFECRIWNPDTQGAPGFSSCTSPYTAPDPTKPDIAELKNFEVRAVDAEGNVDATPASRRFSTDNRPVKNVPAKLKCEVVDIVAGQGKLVRSGCKLAPVEAGKVRCVHIEKLTVRECRFSSRSGSFVRDGDGQRWAVVGQAISAKGKKQGPYVVAASIEQKRIACADVPRSVLRTIHGKDTTGGTTSEPLAGRPCAVEKLLVATNGTGKPLVNFATREVCTSTYPHPDGATLTRVKAPGVYCYTGRGAALNDVRGWERDADGNYYYTYPTCHFALLSSTTTIVVAKRPATSGSQITETSPLVWRPVAPIPIAN